MRHVNPGNGFIHGVTTAIAVRARFTGSLSGHVLTYRPHRRRSPFYGDSNTVSRGIELGTALTDTKTRDTYRAVFAVRDFRFLWSAEVLSVAGDQLTRVALSLLVFHLTHSAAATGLTYGLTFLPTLIGSVFFSGFADHYSRRTVMIVCNVARAFLVAAVAIPGLPLWSLCILISASTVFLGPFKSAEQALMPDLLGDRLYLLGQSLRSASSQSAQLAGFAVGGPVVFWLTPAGGLLFDAATFLVAAALVAGTRPRPATPREGERALSPRGLARGFAAFAHDRRLLVLGTVVALNLFHIVPEGLAAPLVAQWHVGDWAVAVVQAAAPVGAIAGAFVFARLVPDSRQPLLLGPIAIAAGAALVPVWAPLGMWPSVVLFAVTGGLSGIYSMYSAALIAQYAPEQDRGRVIGVNAAVLFTANGLGPMLGGLVAGVVPASTAIALAGVASAILAMLITTAWSSVRREPELTSSPQTAN